MKILLSKLFNIIKFILMFISFALILIGVLFTYKRLEKSLLESINIFLPFILIIILTVINMFNKKAKVNENILFNFTSILVFLSIIIIGLRSKFDTNMLLYHKYQINYNPSYLADNLSSIKVLLYCLAGSNIFLLIQPLFSEKEIINNNNIINKQFEEVKDIEEKSENNVTYNMNIDMESNNMEEL